MNVNECEVTAKKICGSRYENNDDFFIFCEQQTIVSIELNNIYVLEVRSGLKSSIACL